RAGEPHVHGVDPQVRRQLHDLELVLDLRIHDRRRLDAVAQRLVEELERATGRERPDLLDRVPVVDEVLLRKVHHTRSSTTAMPCPPPMQPEPTAWRPPRRPSS